MTTQPGNVLKRDHDTWRYLLRRLFSESLLKMKCFGAIVETYHINPSTDRQPLFADGCRWTQTGNEASFHVRFSKKVHLRKDWCLLWAMLFHFLLLWIRREMTSPWSIEVGMFETVISTAVNLSQRGLAAILSFHRNSICLVRTSRKRQQSVWLSIWKGASRVAAPQTKIGLFLSAKAGKTTSIAFEFVNQRQFSHQRNGKEFH